MDKSARQAKEAADVDPIRLWLRMLSCATLIEREIQVRLKERYGVSLARFDYLAQLYRAGEGELTMTDLGQKLMVSGGNITGLTDRLEKESLVERRADPSDRRVQRIALSDKGRKLFADMAAVHRGWVEDILAGVPVRDAGALMDLLAEVKNSAEQAAERRAGARGGKAK